MEGRKFYPQFAVWELTNRCNARCIHCGSESGDSRQNELTEAEALQLCEELKHLGCERVGIIGGEFFLSPYWESVLKKLYELRIRASLLTNGLLLTDKNIAKLQDLKVRGISVSIDGMGETHDYLRGVPGLYEKAITAIQKVKAAGFSVGINTAISRPNMHQLPELLELLTQLGVNTWQLQWVEDFGRAQANPDLFLTVEDMYPIVRQVAEFRKHTQIKIYLGDNIGHFTCFEPMVRDNPFTGCIAGRYNVGIESNGNIRACLSIRGDEHIEGNIRERSLTAIWDDPASFSIFRDKPVEKLTGFCRTCEYAKICRAGCPPFAYSITGNYYENPMCLHKYEVEHGITTYE